MIPLAFTSASHGPFRPLFSAFYAERNRELAHKDAIITEKIAIIARLEAAAVEKGKATAAAAVEKDKSTAAIIAGYERALDLKDEIVEAKVRGDYFCCRSGCFDAYAFTKSVSNSGPIP